MQIRLFSFPNKFWVRNNTMKKIAIASVMIWALSAAPSQAVTIDFDGLAAGVAVGATFPGVTFVEPVTNAFGTLPGGTTPIAINHSTSGFNAVAGDPLEAVFAGTVGSVSLTGIDISGDGFQLLAFNAGGVMMDSASFTGIGAGVGTFITLTVTGAIKHVEWSQITDGLGTSDGSIYDNFTYTAVPAPAGLTGADAKKPASQPVFLHATNPSANVPQRTMSRISAGVGAPAPNMTTASSNPARSKL
jgi:hypothetical protein